MIRYFIAFAMLACASLAYIILSFGARFDRTDELTSDADTQRTVGKRVEGQRSNHFGGASK